MSPIYVNLLTIKNKHEKDSIIFGGSRSRTGKPVSGVAVYKFKDNGLGEGTTIYKSNAKESETTNSGGIAHFDLKSPDDLDPSDVAGVENSDQATFFFCTYDAEGTRNGIVTVSVICFGSRMLLRGSCRIVHLV